ncbi:MAG: murein biosynthesis integral membrane protein MurJ [Pseudomonadales bacterium]|nr:murein biosynthesis integral membrane protein MurJ [Pseudomonadales bacterium]
MKDLPPISESTAKPSISEAVKASTGGLLKSSSVVSLMTLLSRVLGVVRDMVIAALFGSSAASDAFFLAFRIPNFFRRLFGEGAFSQAFVPVLSEYKATRSENEVRSLVSAISGVLGLNLVLLTVLGVALAPLVIGIFAAGFVYNGEVEKLLLATEMLRLTFPYVLLICMTAFAGSVLNSFGRFAVPALTPVLLNISLIGCALYLAPMLEKPVTALAWGVLIAGVAQLSFQLPFLAQQRMLVRPRIDFKHAGVKQVMKLMLPALFGVSVGQINLLLDTVLASFLETGSLSWLYYSDRLLELPLALFGITIATVILPSLSRQHAAGSAQFNQTLNWAMKMVCLLGVPASVALVVLSESLITTIFYQGEMTPRDVTMAAYSLSAYGIGLLGHMFVKVLAPGYFARQDTRSPVRYGIIALAANMVFNLILVWQLQHAGLALATSLSAFLNAGLLWFGLQRSGVLVLTDDWLKFLCQITVASLMLLGFLLIVLPVQATWLDMAFWLRLGTMLLICGAGAMIYTVCLALVGVKFKQMIR